MFHRQWREQALNSLTEPFDLLIVGGGITGCGVLLDAAQRGLHAIEHAAHDAPATEPIEQAAHDAPSTEPDSKREAFDVHHIIKRLGARVECRHRREDHGAGLGGEAHEAEMPRVKGRFPNGQNQ